MANAKQTNAALRIRHVDGYGVPGKERMSIIKQLRDEGYVSVEGSYVGGVAHLRMLRTRDADTVLLSSPAFGPRMWVERWRGAAEAGIAAWSDTVDRVADDEVRARMRARADRDARRGRGTSDGGGAQ